MSSPQSMPLKATGAAGGQPAVTTTGVTGLTRHIPALDGLRGIAILMVIVCHFVAYALPFTPSRSLLMISSVGGTGVDLFFVLSGFLITRILLTARTRPDFLKNFYARRILRIFPLYYGFLTLIYVIIPLLHLGQPTPIGVQLWTWSYLQNVGMTFFPHQSATIWQWTPHFWSLAVEEHFYLLWPFVVKLADARSLPLVLLGTIPISIISRGLVLWSGHGPAYLTPCRVDALGLGSLLAVLSQHPGALATARRWAPAALLAMVPAGVAGMVVFSGTALPVIQLFKDTGSALAYTLLLVMVLKSQPGGFLQGALAQPALATIGKYSYGMYVLHLTIIGLLGPMLKTIWPPLALLLLVAVVASAAALSWHFLEQPFLRLKRRFKY